jgi:hypothetical protein
MITRIPLQIKSGALATYIDVKDSIDAYIELLLTTPVGSCISDPDFGFILNNLRFEIFNENEGVVLNSEECNNEESVLKVVNYLTAEIKTYLKQWEPTIIEYDED